LFVEFTLNGEKVSAEISGETTALALLRENFDLIGAKEGCGVGECGACTILVDGVAVNGCLYLAGKLDGREVVTVEGVGGEDALDPLQKKFMEHGAVQCGYCTPGMLLSAKALLIRNPKPTLDEVKVAISGNLCRCTGYTPIVKAIMAATEEGK